MSEHQEEIDFLRDRVKTLEKSVKEKNDLLFQTKLLLGKALKREPRPEQAKSFNPIYGPEAQL